MIYQIGFQLVKHYLAIGLCCMLLLSMASDIGGNL